jgi:hypothetical protein
MITMDTEELIAIIIEILYGTTRKKLSRTIFERIEKNKKAQAFIDEKKGWHTLSNSCCRHEGISEFVLMLAASRAKTFDICMSYYSNQSLGFSAPQSKELHFYILSCAEKLAITSSHYVVIAEKMHSKELQEAILIKALDKAKPLKKADNYIEIFYCALETKIEEDKVLLIAGTAIKEAAKISLDFNEIDRILNIISTVKIRARFGPVLRDKLRIRAIIGATESKVSFAHKKSLSTLIVINGETATSMALSLMTWITAIENFKRTTRKLPGRHSLKKISKKLDQNK